MFIYVLIFIQVLCLAFSGNILSPLLLGSAEVGDKIGIVFLTPFVLGALALVLLLGFCLLCYAKFKHRTTTKTITIAEIIFIITALVLALVFLISMEII